MFSHRRGLFELTQVHQQLVPHRRRLHASRDACLHVVLLHPFGQPSHAAVAVERVRPQSAVNTYTQTHTRTSGWWIIDTSGNQCVSAREGTHRWVIDWRSSNAPSGITDMSLPCRDLVGVNPDFKRSLLKRSWIGEFQQTKSKLRSISRLARIKKKKKESTTTLLPDDFALSVVGKSRSKFFNCTAAGVKLMFAFVYMYRGGTRHYTVTMEHCDNDVVQRIFV